MPSLGSKLVREAMDGLRYIVGKPGPTGKAEAIASFTSRGEAEKFRRKHADGEDLKIIPVSKKDKFDKEIIKGTASKNWRRVDDY